MTAGHRVRNRQPEGGSRGEGTFPASGSISRSRLSLRARGTLSSSACVRVMRFLGEFVGRPALGYLAQVHHRDAITEMAHH